MRAMQYRDRPDAPMTTIEVEKGCVRIIMDFDLPGCFVPGHRHVFDHKMKVEVGPVLMEVEGQQQVLRTGDEVDIEAGIRHGLRGLAPNARVACEHRNDDIDPAKLDGTGIPAEWLWRLTLEEDECSPAT